MCKKSSKRVLLGAVIQIRTALSEETARPVSSSFCLTAPASYLKIDGGFDGFCAYVDDLNASLGIPKNFTELGIQNIDVDRVVAGALIDPSTGGNPIKMTKENTTKLLLEIV